MSLPNEVLVLLLDQVPVGVSVFDTDARFVHVNHHMTEANGLPAADHLGRRPSELTPEGASQYQHLVEQVLRTRASILGVSIRVPAGDRQFVADYVPLHDARGAAVGVAAIVVETTGLHRDIDAREQASVDRFRRALDHIIDDVAICEAVRDTGGEIVDFVIEHVNAHSRDGAGRSADELIGRTVLDLYPAWRESGMFDVFRRVVESGEPHDAVELHYEDIVDGERIDGYWSLRVVPFGTGYLVASRDVTDVVKAREEADAARREAERDRDAVDVLQAAALPPTLPTIAGWEVDAGHRVAGAEAPVGGDWYDALVAPDGRVCLVIGDVAGHGVASATWMIQLRNMLRGLLLESSDPSQALTRLNRMAVDGGADTFASIAVVAVDPTSGQARSASAGHLPLVRRTGDGAAELLPAAGGRLLGLWRDADFPGTDFTLEPGEVVVMCTDGLVERRGEVIDEGLERLRDAVAQAPVEPFSGWTERLYGPLLGGIAPDDDICGVALRRLG